MFNITDLERMELAKWIRMAKGSQSLDTFAEKTGVSKYQLSRIMNGKFKETPRKSTLQAIRDNSENKEAELKLSVCLQTSVPKIVDGELTHAPNDIDETLSTMLQASYYRSSLDLLQQCQEFVLGTILQLSDEWLTKHYGDPLDSDFENRYLFIDLFSKFKIHKWHFYFVNDYNDMSDNFFFTFLGKLSCYQSTPEEKFSIVVSTPELYDTLSDKSSNSNATLSVILIDLSEKPYISSESYLELANGITEDDLVELQMF